MPDDQNVEVQIKPVATESGEGIVGDVSSFMSDEALKKSAEKFGITDDQSGKPADKGSNADDGKPAESKKDPDKKDPDKDPAGTGAGADAGDKKKYAGVYETVEALEEGYKNVQSLSDKRQAESQETRLQILELTKQIEQLKVAPSAESIAEKRTAAFDQTHASLMKRPAVKALVEDLAGTTGEDVANKLVGVLSEIVTENNLTLSDLKGELTEHKDLLNATTSVSSFRAKHPELAESLDLEEKFQAALVSFEEKKDDPQFLLEMGLAYANTQLMPKLVEKKAELMLKKMSAEDLAKLQAGAVEGGGGAGGGAGGGNNELSDKDKKMNRVWGFDENEPIGPA